jgi:hypothetical protein
VHYINDKYFYPTSGKTADVICFGSNEGATTITLIIQTPSKAGAFTYTVSGQQRKFRNFSRCRSLNLTGLFDW